MNSNQEIFPKEFKVIVDSNNFEFVQRLLFALGMRWVFEGQSSRSFKSNIEFSFIYAGRHPGIMQMRHSRDDFDVLDIPEFIIKRNISL